MVKTVKIGGFFSVSQGKGSSLFWLGYPSLRPRAGPGCRQPMKQALGSGSERWGRGEQEGTLLEITAS